MNFNAIFDSNDFVLVYDTPSVQQWANQKGINFLDFNNVNLLTYPTRVISFCTSWEHFNFLTEVMKREEETFALVIPQIAFDIDEEVVKYSLDLMAISDFEFAYNEHKKWQDFIINSGIDLEFINSESNSSIKCEFGETINLASIDTLKLKPFDFRSIAQYFELNLENALDSNESFTVNGVLHAEGALFACSPDFHIDYEYDKNLADKIIKDFANSKSNILTFENNNLISCILDDGKNIVNELKILTGQKDSLYPNATEFAIGFNPNISQPIRWEYNAQINEGVFGIHVGIGNGSSGYHFDFMSRSYSPVQ